MKPNGILETDSPGPLSQGKESGPNSLDILKVFEQSDIFKSVFAENTRALER